MNFRPNNDRKFFKLFVQGLLLTGLMFFLIKKGFISIDATQVAFQQWHWTLPSCGILIFSSLLGVFRWQWLLQAQGIHLPILKVLELTWIGTFFNIALPGAVSGDFVKAFYVGDLLKGHKSRIFGTILLDRLAGLSALVFVSAGALLFGFNEYKDTRLFTGIQWMIQIAAFCVFAFYTYLFCIQEHRDPLFQWLQMGTQKLNVSSVQRLGKLLGSVTSIYESIRHYRHHRMTLVRVLLLSIFIHIMIGWCCFNFAQSLGETQISLLSVYIVVPLGLLITAVPIAPAGIGTGNIAFLYLFQLVGASRGADVYSLYACCNLCIGLIGGIAYARLSFTPTRTLTPSKKVLKS